MGTVDKLGSYISQLMATVIESDDDFGFGETRTDYADGSIFSSSQGRDSDL